VGVGLGIDVVRFGNVVVGLGVEFDVVGFTIGLGVNRVNAKVLDGSLRNESLKLL